MKLAALISVYCLCGTLWGQTLDAYLATSNHLEPAQKIEQLSRFFIGKPYLGGALGEGIEGQFDRAPLIRFDAFDCQTYVSTLLALAYSQNKEETYQHIRAIRYRNGNATYLNRLHIASTDWNVENIKNGYLRNISKLFVNSHKQPFYRTSFITIDKPTWLQHRTQDSIRIPTLNAQGQKERLTKLHHLSHAWHTQTSRVEYLPTTHLVSPNGTLNPMFASQLKSGLIMQIVRPKWDLRSTIGTHLQISHLGFILHHNQQWWFHHASTQTHTVTEAPLGSYLATLLGSPTIQGIQLLEITGHTAHRATSPNHPQ